MKKFKKLGLFLATIFGLFFCFSLSSCSMASSSSSGNMSVARAEAEVIDDGWTYHLIIDGGNIFEIGTVDNRTIRLQETLTDETRADLELVLTSVDDHYRLNKFGDEWTLHYDGSENAAVTITCMLLKDTTQVASTISFTLKEHQKSAWDYFIAILNSAVGTTLSITALVAVVWRAVLKIYNFGKNDRKNLVTKEELGKFQNEVKNDMRGYAGQIQRATTDSAMRVIDNRLKDIDDIRETSVEIKLLKKEFDSETKNALEKYDEIKTIGDTVRALSNKVSRIEYNTETALERRSEK